MVLLYFSRSLPFAQPLLGHTFELLGQACEIQPHQIIVEADLHDIARHFCHAVGVVIVWKSRERHLLSIAQQGITPAKGERFSPQRFHVNLFILKVEFQGEDFFLEGSKISIQGSPPQVA